LAGNRALAIAGLVAVFALVATTLLVAKSDSIQGRVMGWKASSSMMSDSWAFGIGFDRFGIEYLYHQAELFDTGARQLFGTRATSWQTAHSDPFQYAIELGVPGIVLFLGMWFSVAREKLTPSESIVDPRLMLIPILLPSLVHSHLSFLPIGLFAFLFGGLSSRHTYSTKPRSLVSMVIAVVLVAMSIWVGKSALSIYPSYKQWLRGAELSAERDWEGALMSFVKAREGLPGMGELEFQLGSALVLDGSPALGHEYLSSSLETFNDRNVHLMIAVSAIDRRDYAAALESISLVKRMFPDHLGPDLIGARALHALGRFAEAREALARCIREDSRIRNRDTAQIRSEALLMWHQYYPNHSIPE